MIPIATEANSTSDTLRLTGGVLALALALGGAALGIRSIQPRARARNNVERVVLWGLLGSSMIAILTTVGIVLSMLFETFHFFSVVPPAGFFFGTVWTRASPPPAPPTRPASSA
jgi:phosphate transport system permease protein